MRSLLPVVLLGLSFFGNSPVVAVSTGESAYSVKEEVSSPRGWLKHSKPSPNHNIILRIGLPQPNFHVLEKHLYEVSDPEHERYGQHLSKTQVEALVAPHDESVELVNKWLGTFGINEDGLVRSPAKDWVTVTVPVSLAEKMLDTTYHVWRHAESGEYLVRTTSYSLPSNLHDHIDVIQPTTMFGRFKKQKSTVFPVDEGSLIDQLAANAAPFVDAVSGVTVDASCNRTITITCLRQLYNAVGFVPSAANNSIGITGYLGQFANIEDLQLFYANQTPVALGSNFTFVSVNGGTNDQTPANAGAEADLDVQFAFGLSHPISPTFFSTPGSPPFIPDDLTPQNTNEPYQDWLDFVLAQEHLPLVISTSYGDDEQTVPKSFAIRACAGFAQLGARGVSLMFSSGDSGVGDGDPNPATQQCFTNDGRNVTEFIPAFPTSCPFITSVGGTTSVPEVAVSRFFSGGGFSNYFAQPHYQKKVVDAYLRALPKGTFAGLFNPGGRAYPDVSAQSDRFSIFLDGRAILIGGTSASSPTFAGFVSLLNDARLNAGLSPLGFLNPFLYSVGFLGLNDITIGHNAGCGTQGFNATKGWDPVTGLGTPNFGKLKELVTSRKDK
ncbi:subtilisin-like protein [Phlegmacium glaucopus]|nr:subtilisin-like protein [Phlegmacium glaucopus]